MQAYSLSMHFMSSKIFQESLFLCEIIPTHVIPGLNKKYQFKIQIVDNSYWDCKSESVSHSVVSDSLWPDGL